MTEAVLDQFNLSDEEGEEFQYKAVDELSDSGSDEDENDFQSMLASIAKVTAVSVDQVAKPDAMDDRPETQVKPSVMDDFIRNFFIRSGMKRSLDAFNTEWYQMMASGKLRQEDIGVVSDIYVRNQELDEQVKSFRVQMEKMEQITAKAKGTWDKFRKERDFHRMHHKRVVQEKNKLMVDIKRLQKHFSAYEPMLKELRAKYEVAMKEKMMMRLERDRNVAKVKSLELQLTAALENGGPKEKQPKNNNTKTPTRRKSKKKLSLPTENGINPFANVDLPPVMIEKVSEIKEFRGHANSIAAVAFHPTKPILATVSDDETWKLWSIPNCELIMTGEGHQGWIAGVDFHPHGTHLITASGDNTIKIWDFVTASCSATLSDHAHPVWETAYHHEGDFLVSCSMDHTAKLWDVATARCRHTFRGHVDSVNSVCFQPFMNSFCTASGDKTISLWDIRSGLCVQTFYGHMNACNSVSFNLKGDTLVSCDADGIVKLWDIRMVAEIATMEAGEHPLNKISFDRSGQVVAAASDDGTIKLLDAAGDYGLKSELKGHQDAVQTICFDPSGNYLSSAGSDCTFRLYST